MKKLVLVELIIICVILGNIPFSYGESTKIVFTPSDDASVDEDAPDEVFGYYEYLAGGFSNSNDQLKGKFKKTLSYLKFDISNIPDSDLFNTININSVELRLLIQTDWANSEHFIVTSYSCLDNTWSEDTITWNNRNCKNINTELHGEDSKIVNTEEFPNSYVWDVTSGIIQARENNLDEITLVISALPMEDIEILQFTDSIEKKISSANLIWFWSGEKEEYGISTSPTLTIFYTKSISTFYDTLLVTLTVILPSLSVIFPVVIWLYKKTKN